MGLFDFLKKPVKSKDNVKIEMVAHEPTHEEMAAQWKQKTKEKVRNFQKDDAGLYPHEILMLSYIEKYSEGKEPARFWEREYAVDDVPGLIRSLEERGFAENGKLTDLGRSEIAKNEYVLYMHRHKFSDISMSDMSILVNRNPDMNYRDLLWAEFNRLSIEYMKNRRFGWYRNIKYTMYQFVMEEKRYPVAFRLLAETVFYDLNGSASPMIPPALIRNIRDIAMKLDYSDEEMIDVVQNIFDGMYSPYRNYTNDEVTCIIVAYAFGHDDMAERILSKKKK